MASRAARVLDRLRQRRALAQWALRAARAGRGPAGDLRRQQLQARELRAALDAFLVDAGTRLAAARAEDAPLPPGADWSWRPPFWRSPLPGPGLAAVASQTPITEGMTLFHDCDDSSITIRQLQTRPEAPAPFALAMDVLDFGGSFLSLAIDLPPSACAGLERRHLVGLVLEIAAERRLEIFARLNIRHGPNIAQQVHELPVTDGRVTVEFDLAYMRLNERRIEGAWLDLILDRPAMSAVALADVMLARYPRAEI